MEVDIDDQKGESSIREAYLSAATILRYLVGDDDQLETLIMCNPANQNFVTTDQDLYNALGSVKTGDKFTMNKVIKLLEVTKIRPAKKRVILKDEWVDKTRFEALKQETAEEKDDKRD